MISSLKHWVSNWFKETTIWWFTTLFGRIGVLFSIAAFVLVLVTYYVINWGYTGRDDILDAHDAYHYNSLVSSWGSPPDISILERELNNLKLKCSIFIADNDTICANDTLIYWSNHIKDLSLCNYLSYGSTEDYFETHGIHYANYVSFGDLEFDQDIVQATFVQQDTFKYLITLDIPPTQPPTFFPFIILALLSLSTLYLITRRFLQPISLIEKRIVALEAGDLDSTLPVVGKDELAVLSNLASSWIVEFDRADQIYDLSGGGMEAHPVLLLTAPDDLTDAPDTLEIRAVAYDNASVLVHQTTLQLDLEKLDTYSPPMVSLWPEAHDNQFANSTGALNIDENIPRYVEDGVFTTFYLEIF